jgi:hypothetical protein
MNLAALISAAVLLAPNPDPGPPPKDCPHFAAHYRELIQSQAALDSALGRTPQGESPPLREVGRARQEGAQAAGNLEDDVARACREANGSQYECVVSANSYDDLAACQLRALPVLGPDELATAAELPSTPEPATREEGALGAGQVASEYVQRGTIDVEALGTGSGAPRAEERAAPESDVVKSGR